MTAAWPDRLTAGGPKRILSIDGGGVRGALAVGILRRIESELRDLYGRPDLVLSDYFDLIGGTSTGAIIATGLAMGRTTEYLENLYRTLGPRVFHNPGLRFPGIQARFDPRRLETVILEEVGDVSLGSAAWKSGFCAVSKRVDTGSVWVLSNSPRSKYWQGDPAEPASTVPNARKVIANRDYPLYRIIQASAAAPFYFDLANIEIEAGRPGVFFDGAMTPHGNPALQLAMTALIPAYGFDWNAGRDELLIVSVGTGAPRPVKPGWVRPPLLAVWKAFHALMSLTYDTTLLAVATLQWLGVSRQPWHINSEVGGLDEARPRGMAPLWTFQRYDAPLEQQWLRDNLGIEVDNKALPKLQRLDDDRQIPQLLDIGREAGRTQVRREHFPPAFDPMPRRQSAIR